MKSMSDGEVRADREFKSTLFFFYVCAVRLAWRRHEHAQVHADKRKALGSLRIFGKDVLLEEPERHVQVGLRLRWFDERW